MGAMRLLVVDDDPAIRALGRALAEQVGCSDVVDVADGAGAVALAQECPFDLALVDFHMPGMDGVETTRRLLAICPGLEIFAWTSVLDPGVERAFLAAGATRHIPKTETAQLVAELARCAS